MVFKKGNIPWNRGKTKEIDIRVVKNAKGVSEALKGKKLPEKIKRKISDSLKGRKKEWLSIQMKKSWNNKEWRENQIKKILKASLKRPTILEKQMIEIINRNNLPYRYTGNGNFIVAGKNPDFINCNGEKIAIEVFNSYWKEKDFNTVEKWKQQRQEIFAKYGWQLLFFDETQVKNGENIIRRLEEVRLDGNREERD